MHFNLIGWFHFDEGEDSKSAVIKELREETGVSSAEVIAEV